MELALHGEMSALHAKALEEVQVGEREELEARNPAQVLRVYLNVYDQLWEYCPSSVGITV